MDLPQRRSKLLAVRPFLGEDAWVRCWSTAWRRPAGCGACSGVWYYA
jgi:hypothetical protein